MSDLTEPVAEVPSCIGCGTVAAGVPPPFDWSRSVERGALVWTCPGCTRTHLRSIEGKLDSAWW